MTKELRTAQPEFNSKFKKKNKHLSDLNDTWYGTIKHANEKYFIYSGNSNNCNGNGVTSALLLPYIKNKLKENNSNNNNRWVNRLQQRMPMGLILASWEKERKTFLLNALGYNF